MVQGESKRAVEVTALALCVNVYGVKLCKIEMFLFADHTGLSSL